MMLTGTYWAAFVWGMVVLVSWIGWGEMVRRAARVEAARVGWALRAGWGMAAVLGICGILQWVHACDWNALMLLVLAGVAAFGVMSWRRMRTMGRERVEWRQWAWAAPIAVLLLYLYATSVVAFDLDWWDDLPNYLVYVKKLWATGAMVEPFSLRRLLTYGGQQVLQGMVHLPGGAEWWLHADLLEQGIGRMVFAGLVMEMTGAAGKRRWWVAAVVLVFLFVPRVTLPWLNTHSEMTGVVLFLTLLRTLKLDRGESWLLGAVAGMVAAGMCSMRVSYMPAAVFGVVFCYGIRMLMERRRWREHVRGVAAAGLACAVLMLPWALGLKESSGTLLNPLWLGNQLPEFTYLGARMTLLQKARFAAGSLVYGPLLVLLLPLALTVHRRRRRTELPLSLAAVATVLMTAFTYTMSSYENIYRFGFPVVYGVAAVVLASTMAAGRSRVERAAGVVGVALVGAVFLWPGVAWEFGDRSRVWTEEAQSPLLSVVGSGRAYQLAQQSVPAGEKIFSATSFPVLFDEGRNPIFIADVPGAASPRVDGKGMPIFEGGEAVSAYFRKLGIGYVIFTWPEVDRTLYSKEYWEGVAARPEGYPADHVRVARFNVAFIRSMEELAARGEVLYRSRTLCVVKLK